MCIVWTFCRAWNKPCRQLLVHYIQRHLIPLQLVSSSLHPPCISTVCLFPPHVCPVHLIPCISSMYFTFHAPITRCPWSIGLKTLRTFFYIYFLYLHCFRLGVLISATQSYETQSMYLYLCTIGCTVCCMYCSRLFLPSCSSFNGGGGGGVGPSGRKTPQEILKNPLGEGTNYENG